MTKINSKTPLLSLNKPFFLSILLFLLFSLLPNMANSTELIKIEILKDQQSVRITGSKQGSVDIDSEPGVSMRTDDDESYKTLTFDSYKNSMKINGESYRNTITVNAQEDGKGLQVINELPLEDYLVGLINNEISSRWARDAVRAQAIIARTYALIQKKKRAGEPYHLVGTDIDQVYKGSGTEDRAARRAVEDTTGMVLFYEGDLALTLYHSNAGGRTESAKNVWGGDYPYLRSVGSHYDKRAPRYEWKYTISIEELTFKLTKKGYDIEKIKAITIKKKTPSKRVVKLRIKGKPGTIELTGEELRSLLGFSNIRSTMFKVKKSRGEFKFFGKGSGHGVGLSQWGAKGMAEAGRSYKGILKHYYPGTKIEKIY